ncbi:three-Cys-motif partner protein TcmP [Burkholderia glumae]|uniref:three-Cys-motif partner protein TcmP n=1 Tax=Burkholderia glumae TaxID=337 RepID=UPI0020C6B32B|nr:three-Cys-motif partner protein TcmP [Burkholderia glumae]
MPSCSWLDSLKNPSLHKIRCGSLLDPFNAGHLHFSSIKKLATKPTMDIVVHLSTGDIQRNIAAGLEADHSPLDNFAPGWRHVVKKQSSKHAMRDAFVGHWRALVSKAGMHVCDTMYPVRNSKESTIYWLCLRGQFKNPAQLV